MKRSRLSGRRIGGILAASLFILSAMPGLASADNNSRTLWIGAPDLSIDTDGDGTPDNSGILAPTPITKPAGSNVHSTYFAVEILSTDNQNLAHTVLTVTVPVQAHMTLTGPFDPGPTSTTDADVCVPSDGVGTKIFTCDYGSLSAHGERTIAFVADIDSLFDTTTQATTFVSAKVETNNETGPNQQRFFADSGTFQVQGFNANHVASWVASGKSKVFSTAALTADGAGNLFSTVQFDTSANETFSLTDGTTVLNGKYQCPTVNNVLLSCQDDYSEAVTTTGTFTAGPYFRWTLTALVPKTYSVAQGFVAHYPTNATDYDWILYFKNKSAFCGTDIDAKIKAQGHCILSTPALTKYNKTYNQLVFTVVMNHQGGMKY